MKGMVAPPHTAELYQWADYVEIQCDRSADGQYTLADAADEVLDRTAERTDVSDFSGQAEPDADGGDAEPPTADDGERDRRRESWQEDVLATLRYRRRAFGPSYPFRLIGSRRAVSLRPRPAASSWLYRYLLHATHLSHLGSPTRGMVTRLFESVSRDAISAYLGNSANVHLFHRSEKYAGNLATKITALAADFGYPPRKLDGLPPTSSGDGGSDIVGWFDFRGDGIGQGKVTVLGQSTCATNWTKKQADACKNRWEALIDFLASPNMILCIPGCFRSTNGDWCQPHNVWRQTVLFDRLRIVQLLAGRASRLAEREEVVKVMKRLERAALQA